MRDQGIPIRKIAKKIKISTDSVCKYSKINNAFIKKPQKETMPYPQNSLLNNNNIGIIQQTKSLNYINSHPPIIDPQRVEYNVNLYYDPSAEYQKSEIDSDRLTQLEISERQRQHEEIEDLKKIYALQKDILNKQREQKRRQTIERYSRKIDNIKKFDKNREQNEKQFAEERKQEVETRETDEETKKLPGGNFQKETEINLREIPESNKMEQMNKSDTLMICSDTESMDQEQEVQNIDYLSIGAFLIDIFAAPVGNWVGTKMGTYIIGINSSDKPALEKKIVKKNIYLKESTSENIRWDIYNPPFNKLPTVKLRIPR